MPADYNAELQRLFQTVDSNDKVPVKNKFVAPSVSHSNPDWALDNIWSTGFIDTFKDRLYALTVERCVSSFFLPSLPSLCLPLLLPVVSPPSRLRSVTQSSGKEEEEEELEECRAGDNDSETWTVKLTGTLFDNDNNRYLDNNCFANFGTGTERIPQDVFPNYLTHQTHVEMLGDYLSYVLFPLSFTLHLVSLPLLPSSSCLPLPPLPSSTLSFSLLSPNRLPHSPPSYQRRYVFRTAMLTPTPFPSSSSALAQAANLPFIMFETNTASCGGFAGVSQSFGAALWILDYGMQMAYSNFSHALLHVGGQNVFYNPWICESSLYRSVTFGCTPSTLPSVVCGLAESEGEGEKGEEREEEEDRMLMKECDCSPSDEPECVP
ncbi:hypothetical protein NMY22_g19846 [Coprinellus aureogranulatus]|nr:hypothetical protein NMY22_g19846 [Coprinellus aureogranulatus]